MQQLSEDVFATCLVPEAEQLPYFFTYKPSDFFSIWHKSLEDFFHKKRGSAYVRGFGIQKQVQI